MWFLVSIGESIELVSSTELAADIDGNEYWTRAAQSDVVSIEYCDCID